MNIVVVFSSCLKLFNGNILKILCKKKVPTNRVLYGRQKKHILRIFGKTETKACNVDNKVHNQSFFFCNSTPHEIQRFVALEQVIESSTRGTARHYEYFRIAHEKRQQNRTPFFHKVRISDRCLESRCPVRSTQDHEKGLLVWAALFCVFGGTVSFSNSFLAVFFFFMSFALNIDLKSGSSLVFACFSIYFL